jgi:glycosyltransferase involved in cell wall biosynthesis
MTTNEDAANSLIWTGRSYELPTLPPLDPATWLGAIQMNVKERPLANAFDAGTWKPASPVHFVSALLMIKNEEDIIFHNLAWIYYIGIRKIVVINNNSDDATSAILKRFRTRHPDVEMLIVNDAIVRYIQGQKMTGIMRLAASVWPDCEWVVPVDADEFLVPDNGLHNLKNIPDEIDAIVIPKAYHHVRLDKADGRNFENDTFARMSIRTELHRAPPKILLRPRAFLKLGPGNHYAIPVNELNPVRYSSGQICGAYYREFSIRSYHQFKKKVVDGGVAIEEAEKLGLNVGGSHWKSRYAGYKSGGEEWLKQKYVSEFCRSVSDNFILDEFPVSAITDSYEMPVTLG